LHVRRWIHDVIDWTGLGINKELQDNTITQYSFANVLCQNAQHNSEAMIHEIEYVEIYQIWFIKYSTPSLLITEAI